MVMYFCEAWEVNKLTVLAVGPNGHKDDDDKDEDKIASSGSDPPKGSDKYRLYLEYICFCCHSLSCVHWVWKAEVISFSEKSSIFFDTFDCVV